MKITRISVTWERKFDLGEWESQKCGAYAFAELAPDEGTLDEARKKYQELGALVRTHVRDEAIKLLSQAKGLRVINERNEVISIRPFIITQAEYDALVKESGDAEMVDPEPTA